MNKLSTNNRYLILNADDFGMSHSTNQAIIKLLDDNIITSTSLMPVCPWFEEAAEYLRQNPKVDVGIHLTFTSEWKYYKWSALSKCKSLMSESGYLPNSCIDIEKNATEDAIVDEIWYQINKVKSSLINFNNIDNHMGSLYGLCTGRSFLPIVFDICSQLNMPFRFPKNFSVERMKNINSNQIEAFESLRDLALLKNIKLIDNLIEYPFHLEKGETYKTFVAMIINILRNIEIGVSELYIHPSLNSEEIRAINPSWQKRVMEYNVFYEDKVQNVIKEEGIQLISWKDLRENS